jgi:hypothetical protein
MKKPRIRKFIYHGKDHTGHKWEAAHKNDDPLQRAREAIERLKKVKYAERRTRKGG